MLYSPGPYKGRAFFKLDNILAATLAEAQLDINLFPEAVGAGEKRQDQTPRLRALLRDQPH